MAARITPETIFQLVLVCLLANIGADKSAAYARILDFGVTSHNILGQVSQVGHTSRKKIRSWFSKHVLHAVGDEPCSND